MSEELEKRIESLHKILADPTRRKILDLISETPLNPQELASKLNISRPAVEKHLKLLLTNYFCERSVDPFPTPHYVYFASDPGLELINAINIAMIEFFQSMDGIVAAEIEQLERDFLLERINRAEYDTRKQSLAKKQRDLETLQLTRIWIEEAKKLVTEYQEGKE
ncbi:MAG: winged helix-turn-helix transcriptional regulator [Candidatus Heimdallarchaeota archaeon]|nr:MAG: winged helix-turn-helix transcriptional regulator [Candidatus Heimdallarchaeota archaeon]